MKKTLSLLLLIGGTSMLYADCGSCSGQGYNQGYYQNSNDGYGYNQWQNQQGQQQYPSQGQQQYYQGQQQYPAQGQQQYPYQGQQQYPSQGQQQYYQGQQQYPSQGQFNVQNSNQQGYNQSGSYNQGQYQQNPYQDQNQYQQSQYPQGQTNQGQFQYDQQSNNGYSQGMSPQSNSSTGFPSQAGGSNFSGQQNANIDQAFAAQIQKSLQGVVSSKYNNVTVTSSNGVVTLRGTVPTQDDKASLEQKVRNMDGVRDVNNQVTIQNK